MSKLRSINLVLIWGLILFMILTSIFLYRLNLYSDSKEFTPVVIDELNQSNFLGYVDSQWGNSTNTEISYYDFSVDEDLKYGIHDVETSMRIEINLNELILDQVVINKGEEYSFRINRTKPKSIFNIYLFSLNSSEDLSFKFTITQFTNSAELTLNTRILERILFDCFIILLLIVFRTFIFNAGGYWTGYPRSSIKGLHQNILLMMLVSLMILRMMLYVF